MNRGAAGTDEYITGGNKTSLFQDVNLIKENIIQAYFFIIKEGANAPAETELINKRFFFCENIEE